VGRTNFEMDGIEGEGDLVLREVRMRVWRIGKFG
jgi:hypothetical protein